MVWARPGTSLRHDPPSICAPDLYMSASVLSFQKNQTMTAPKVSQRYLLFEPQYGGNNQLYAIVEAMSWANALDRQLVMPPIFLPRVSDFDQPFQDWPVTENFFKIREVTTSGLHNQPVGFQEWFKLNVPLSRILHISRDAVFDKPARLLTDTVLQTYSPEGTELPTVDLRHLFEKSNLGAKVVKHLLGGCSDDVLSFDGMFFANMESKINKWEQVALRHNIWKTYNVIKLKLQDKLGQEEYACYHIRLGDFVSICSTIDKHRETVPHWVKWIAEGYKCVVTAEEVNLAAVMLGMPTLVMSNSATAIEDYLDTDAIGMVSSEWVKEAILVELASGTNEAEQDILSLIFEQELCADAEVSILNKFSSVSERIDNMRKLRGKSSHYWHADTSLSLNRVVKAK